MPRDDHYLPAALIGGFGIPSTRRKKTGLRYAKVALREHDDPGEVKERRAEKVAKTLGEYWIQHPSPGVSHEALDDLWKKYEPYLADSIKRFENGTWTIKDWKIVRHHLVAQSCRNPDYERQARQYRAAMGHPITHRDEVQNEKFNTLANTPPLLARGRFALFRVPEDDQRFVINDKGFATVEDEVVGRKGVLFPLSGTLAVVIVNEVGPSANHSKAFLSREFVLTSATVELWNQASWQQTEARCVIGHPDHEKRILSLDHQALRMPELGPFRRHGRIGMFDWGFESFAEIELTPPASVPGI